MILDLITWCWISTSPVPSIPWLPVASVDRWGPQVPLFRVTCLLVLSFFRSSLGSHIVEASRVKLPRHV